MKYKISRFLFLIVFFTSTLFAEPVTAPPSDKITIEQYRFALKNAVRLVPELADLWIWTHKHELKDFYLGGGILRGLVRWLHIQLQNHPYDSVIQMKPPSIFELLIVKEADKDLYIPATQYDVIKGWKTYSDWDLIKDDFYQNTIRNQGSTLDKLSVSPGYYDDIRDPLEAIDMLYHGKIEFKLPTDISKIPEVVTGDTRLGLAMRFLRFMNDMKDVVTPTEQSMILVKRSIQEEKHLIPVCESEHPKWPASNEATVSKNTQVRISRNTKSLFKSLGNNAYAFIKFLKEHDLYTTLASNHYGVDTKFTDPVNTLAEFRVHGLTHEDMFLFGQMTAWDVNRARSYHQFLNQHALSDKEIVKSFEPLWNTQSESYKSQLAQFYSQELPSSIIRMSFKDWTNQEWENFTKIFVGYPDLAPMIETARQKRNSQINLDLPQFLVQVKNSRSNQEIIDLLNRWKAEIPKHQENQFLVFLNENLGQWFEKINFDNITQNEIEEFDKASPTVKASIEFKMRVILRVGFKFPASTILKTYVQSPSSEYLRHLDQLKLDAIDSLLRLNRVNTCRQFYY